MGNNSFWSTLMELIYWVETEILQTEKHYKPLVGGS